MKTQRTRPVKTEQSVEKVEEGKKDKKDWVFYSLLKNRKKVRTPLRFADVICEQNKRLESTHEGSAGEKGKELDQSINKAINILKEQSGIRREKNQNEISSPEAESITPFSLQPQLQGFQEQLSFKGAGNRLVLLTRLNQIQTQANFIFQEVKQLNHNSSIDFITFKLMKAQQKDIKVSYYDFYSHLENITKKISDLVVELTRCRNIMGKIGTGITLKTMQFYINKFEGLIDQMRTGVAHLKSYIQMLTRTQRDSRDNRPPKRCLPVHKTRTQTIA